MDHDQYDQNCTLTGPTAAASSAHPTCKNASGISPPSTRPPAAPRTAPRVQRRGASTPKRAVGPGRKSTEKGLSLARASLAAPGGRRPRARRRQRVAPPASRSTARVARAARRRPGRQTTRAVPLGHVPGPRPGTPLGARGGFVRRGAPRRRRRRVWASRSRRVLLPGPSRRWRSFRAIAVWVAKWSREPRTRDRDPSHMDEIYHVWSILRHL